MRSMRGRSCRSTAGFVRRVPVTFYFCLAFHGLKRDAMKRHLTPGPRCTWSPEWRKFCGLDK